MARERMDFGTPNTSPVEEKVTIEVPKSTFELFNALQGLPVQEVLPERWDKYSALNKVKNLDLYPKPEEYTDLGNPRGTLDMGVLEESAFYPGTKHRWGLYVPAQYKEDEPANLVVQLDGNFYLPPEPQSDEAEESEDGTKFVGSKNTPMSRDMLPSEDYPEMCFLYDNLIAQGRIPTTVVFFADFGVPGPGQPFKGFREGEVNRSFEYDTPSDWNARFLTEEFMPSVLAGLSISADPAHHVVAGISSSGIGAFAVAWFKPEVFGNVVVGSPSFVNIRHGIVWPSVIRATLEPKPIRMIAEVGRHDGDNNFGNWLNGTYDVACALHLAGYDHRLYLSESGHASPPFLCFLPQALEWAFTGKEPQLENFEFATYPELLL